MPVFSQGLIQDINEQNLVEIEKFINKQKSLVLGTVDEAGYPRLSVINNLPNQKFEKMYFASKLNSHKSSNIQSNPEVEIMFFDGINSCIIRGRALLLGDKQLKKRLWQPWMENLFFDGVEDPEYLVLEISPIECRVLID